MKQVLEHILTDLSTADAEINSEVAAVAFENLLEKAKIKNFVEYFRSYKHKYYPVPEYIESILNCNREVVHPYTLAAEVCGHSGEVDRISFDKGSRFFVSGGADGIIKLWDLYTGMAVYSFIGHRSLVNDICFSYDGVLMASCDSFGILNVWSLRSFELLFTVNLGHEVNFAEFFETVRGDRTSKATEKSNLEHKDDPLLEKTGDSEKAGVDVRNKVEQCSNGKVKHEEKMSNKCYDDEMVLSDVCKSSILAERSSSDSKKLDEVKTSSACISENVCDHDSLHEEQDVDPKEVSENTDMVYSLVVVTASGLIKTYKFNCTRIMGENDNLALVDNTIKAICITEGGRFLLCSGWWPYLLLIDTHMPDSIITLETDNQSVHTVCAAKSNLRFAAACENMLFHWTFFTEGSPHMGNFKKKHKNSPLTGHWKRGRIDLKFDGTVERLCLLQNGWFVCVCSDMKLRLACLTYAKHNTVYELDIPELGVPHPHPTKSLFILCGNRLSFYSMDKLIKTEELPYSINDCQFSGNGEFFVTGDDRGICRVYSLYGVKLGEYDRFNNFKEFKFGTVISDAMRVYLSGQDALPICNNKDTASNALCLDSPYQCPPVVLKEQFFISDFEHINSLNENTFMHCNDSHTVDTNRVINVSWRKIAYRISKYEDERPWKIENLAIEHFSKNKMDCSSFRNSVADQRMWESNLIEEIADNSVQSLVVYEESEERHISRFPLRRFSADRGEFGVNDDIIDEEDRYHTSRRGIEDEVGLLFDRSGRIRRAASVRNASNNTGLMEEIKEDRKGRWIESNSAESHESEVSEEVSCSTSIVTSNEEIHSEKFQDSAVGLTSDEEEYSYNRPRRKAANYLTPDDGYSSFKRTVAGDSSSNVEEQSLFKRPRRKAANFLISGEASQIDNEEATFGYNRGRAEKPMSSPKMKKAAVEKPKRGVSVLLRSTANSEHKEEDSQTTSGTLYRRSKRRAAAINAEYYQESSLDKEDSDDECAYQDNIEREQRSVSPIYIKDNECHDTSNHEHSLQRKDKSYSVQDTKHSRNSGTYNNGYASMHRQNVKRSSRSFKESKSNRMATSSLDDEHGSYEDEVQQRLCTRKRFHPNRMVSSSEDVNDKYSDRSEGDSGSSNKDMHITGKKNKAMKKFMDEKYEDSFESQEYDMDYNNSKSVRNTGMFDRKLRRAASIKANLAYERFLKKHGTLPNDKVGDAPRTRRLASVFYKAAKESDKESRDEDSSFLDLEGRTSTVRSVKKLGRNTNLCSLSTLEKGVGKDSKSGLSRSAENYSISNQDLKLRLKRRHARSNRESDDLR